MKPHKASLLIIAILVVVTTSIMLAPAFSQSSNPCSPCHGAIGYSQSLDILQNDPQTSTPSALEVGKTATVTVAFENNVNATLFTALSNVSLNLSSENEHFSIKNPTITFDSLQKGTTLAKWQIDGTSTGLDKLIITAKAQNQHQNLQFLANYTPAINVKGPTDSSPTNSTSPNTIQPNSQPANTSNKTNSTAILQDNQRFLKIWFVNPREGEAWNAGNTQTIEWITSGGIGNSIVKLELSKSGAGEQWIAIEKNQLNSSKVNLNIDNLKPGSYLLKATVTDSANPPDTTSITVAVTLVLQQHEYAALMLTSMPIMLPIVIGALIILRKRLNETQIRKKQLKR